MSPWKVYHENGKYCLHKHVDGKKGELVPGGCHSTPEQARKHQAALYVSEKKEIDPLDLMIEEVESEVEDEANAMEQQVEDIKEISRPELPAGIATSFAELDAQREYTGRMRELDDLMGDFQSLVGNIIYTPETLLEEDKVKALGDLFDEFTQKVDETLNQPLENKELDIAEKAVWTTEYINNLPDSSFLYIEPGGKKDGEGKTTPRSYRHLPVKDASGKPDAAHIKNAESRANQVKLHTGGRISAGLANRLIARARAMLKRVKKEDNNFLDNMVLAVKEAFGIEEPDTYHNTLTIWKEEDGSYGWLSTYSNMFMDNDHPPDILSSESHKKFVENVDKGLVPMPELWIWHVPEWKVGYATAVAYDDAGFPVALGKFDDDCKEIAEWMSTQEDFGVSHGMWKKSLKRDPEDESVITEYETYEISPLPRSRAANKLADFVVLSKEKEDDMTIPEEKREELLKRGLPENILSALEARNKIQADKAIEAGIKSKEEEDKEEDLETQPVPEETQADSTEAPETTEETPAEETTPAPTMDMSQYPTREEVAEAIATVVAPMINEIKESVATVEANLKELQDLEDTRIKELIATTPRDSLASYVAQRMMNRSSTDKDTVLPKGDDLLGKKPKEAKKEVRSVTGVSFIDKMITTPEQPEDEE